MPGNARNMRPSASSPMLCEQSDGGWGDVQSGQYFQGVEAPSIQVQQHRPPRTLCTTTNSRVLLSCVVELEALATLGVKGCSSPAPLPTLPIGGGSPAPRPPNPMPLPRPPRPKEASDTWLVSAAAGSSGGSGGDMLAPRPMAAAAANEGTDPKAAPLPMVPMPPRPL